jgi:hypothetical protein
LESRHWCWAHSRTVGRLEWRRAAAAGVTAARIADADSAEWLAVGRTYDEQRFSPLKRIDTTNVGKLGLAWFADFDTNRGEATPLVIDGVLHVSTAWSKVKAYDARTGRPLWAYDPKVPGEFAGSGCCDVVNRGLAAWNGKVYVASYDGRDLQGRTHGREHRTAISGTCRRGERAAAGRSALAARCVGPGEAAGSVAHRRARHDRRRHRGARWCSAVRGDGVLQRKKNAPRSPR